MASSQRLRQYHRRRLAAYLPSVLWFLLYVVLLAYVVWEVQGRDPARIRNRQIVHSLLAVMFIGPVVCGMCRCSRAQRHHQRPPVKSHPPRPEA